MNKKNETILTINLGLQNDNKEIMIHSIDELMNFIKCEKEYWRWASLHSGKENNNIHSIYNYQMGRFNDIEMKLVNIKSSNEEQTVALKHDINNIFKDIYSVRKSLHSSSPKAKFIEQIKEKNPIVAGYILGYFIGLENLSITHNHVDGIINAVMFERGYTSNIEAEKKSLNQMKGDWGDVFQSYNNELIELNNSYVETANNIRTVQKNQKEKFNELIDKYEVKLNEIADLYDRKLALQSSVSYWGNRYKDHRLYSWLAGLASLLAGLCVYFISDNIYGYINSNNAGTNNTDIGIQNFWEFALVLVPVVLGLWGLKILVKILLSHMHLGSDAKEREIMIKTYLALLREGNLDKEDKQLILQTLFRPSLSGIIKEENIPFPSSELLNRLGLGGK